MTPRNQLDKFIAQTLAGALGIDPERAERAAWAITRNWRVDRVNTPTKDAHPLASQEYGHLLRISTEWQPETPAEVADREARAAASAWAYGDQDGPPPERVSINHLLDQDIWWRARAADRPGSFGPIGREQLPTVAIKLADMDLHHKVALLAWLRKRAAALHDREAAWLGNAPDDVWRSWEQENPHEWIERQPLVKALVWQTTPIAGAPLTWQPLSEVDAGMLVIVRRYGHDEQIWARYISGEWWQIVEHGWTQIPPEWIRETGCEWRLPYPGEAQAADVLPMEPMGGVCEHGRLLSETCLLCEDGVTRCPHGTQTDCECIRCWEEY